VVPPKIKIAIVMPPSFRIIITPANYDSLFIVLIVIIKASSSRPWSKSRTRQVIGVKVLMDRAFLSRQITNQELESSLSSLGSDLGILNFVSNQRFPGYQIILRNSYVPVTLLPISLSTSVPGEATFTSTPPSSQTITRPWPKASSSNFLLLSDSTGKFSRSTASLLSPGRSGGAFKRDQERKIPFWTIRRSKCDLPVLC
jgi:hypothetical protein